MKKIAFILCFLCTILFMVYILFGFFRYVNFRVDSAGMQKLSLVGENDANMYLLTLKLTHCNKQLYFGCMPYPGGISDSVIQIKVSGSAFIPLQSSHLFVSLHHSFKNT